MSWLALDIGGANIKIANGAGYAHSLSFPLWRQPEQLSLALQSLLDEASAAESLAVTITGELADCFVTKAEGITAIVEAVEAATPQKTSVYLCDGRLVPPATAKSEPLLAAASNWHVLANFATRYLKGEYGLLIDVGSTTCDLIPLSPSGPHSLGKTDPERLAAGELVYTGIERSPLCAVVSKIPWHGQDCPTAQELFATTADAYVLLEKLPADPNNTDTADGRPRTVACAHARMARFICADTTMFSLDDAQQAARAVYDAQLELLKTATRQVLDRMDSPPSKIILSGHGDFLSQRLLEHLHISCPTISLTEEFGPEVSRSACAHALAVLASERDNP